MRIFVWHGYLLAGTGSNIYARQLAREWMREGHEVVVFSQESHPERYDLGGAETVRPDVGGLLPVFVIDEYEGYEVKRVQDCTRAELDAWVEANAAAMRERLPADFVFANHVLLGGPVGAAVGARYVVKAHGSELEYSMRGNAELSAWGQEALAGAAAAIVGSEHIREVLQEVCGQVDRVHEIPPGVDVELWVPAPKEEALAALLAESRQDPPNPGNANERLPDEGNADRLEVFLAGDRPTVVYFGKLIENKGVQVLFEALRGVDARAVIVGFGDYRAELERLAEGLDVLFTGPLEHRHLVHLLALADAAVVPSIFPEAFGMVAAESAAAGCPPIVANHSGLAEIAQGLERHYPPELRHLPAFPSGDADELRSRLDEQLPLTGPERDALRAAARQATVDHWSWTSVARRILAAAVGGEGAAGDSGRPVPDR
jgi:glycosyltransferase involved in cell wall biosynthesis